METYQLEKATNRFCNDMRVRGFVANGNKIVQLNSEKEYKVLIESSLSGPSVRVSFVCGNYDRGDGVYVFVPGKLETAVSSLKEMAAGTRLLTEIDYWANENAELVERRITKQQDEYDPDIRRKMSDIWAKYKINPGLFCGE